MTGFRAYLTPEEGKKETKTELLAEEKREAEIPSGLILVGWDRLWVWPLKMHLIQRFDPRDFVLGR